MNQDPEFNPLAELINEITRRDREGQAISELTSKLSMETESDVLIGVWQHLGDHTETYFEAMQVCYAIVSINKAIEKHAAGFSPELIVTILDTVGKLAASQANCQKMIIAKKAELRGATSHDPKP